MIFKQIGEENLNKAKKTLASSDRKDSLRSKEWGSKKKKEDTRQISVKRHHSKDNDKVSQSPRQEKQVIDTERESGWL